MFMSVSDLSSPSETGGATFGPSPSVSKSQWANFALRKLREDYALLQLPSGTVFQFYKPGEPLQPCTPHAAKKLVAMGLLTVTKTDIRGTHYALRPAFQPEASAEA